MHDPSHSTSSSYKVDKQKYDENWDRIFGKQDEEQPEIDSQSRE